MLFKIEIKEEAKADIADAMAWYKPKATNLDKKFLLAAETTLKKIQQNPFAFKKVYKNLRQAVINRFPYVIIYIPEQKIVFIFAVFNTWQHPKKKIKRLIK